MQLEPPTGRRASSQPLSSPRPTSTGGRIGNERRRQLERPVAGPVSHRLQRAGATWRGGASMLEPVSRSTSAPRSGGWWRRAPARYRGGGWCSSDPPPIGRVLPRSWRRCGGWRRSSHSNDLRRRSSRPSRTRLARFSARKWRRYTRSRATGRRRRSPVGARRGRCCRSERACRWMAVASPPASSRRALRPQIVLPDLQLPHLSGLEVARRIARRGGEGPGGRAHLDARWGRFRQPGARQGSSRHHPQDRAHGRGAAPPRRSIPLRRGG